MHFVFNKKLKQSSIFSSCYLPWNSTIQPCMMKIWSQILTLWLSLQGINTELASTSTWSAVLVDDLPRERPSTTLQDGVKDDNTSAQQHYCNKETKRNQSTHICNSKGKIFCRCPWQAQGVGMSYKRCKPYDGEVASITGWLLSSSHSGGTLF